MAGKKGIDLHLPAIYYPKCVYDFLCIGLLNHKYSKAFIFIGT